MGIGDKLKKVRQLGAAGSMKMAAVKWKKLELTEGGPTAPGRRAILDKIFSRDYKRIVIFENHFGYRNIMMQRPQHLLKNMGDSDTLVLYNSYYDIDFEDRGRITRIDRSVYVLDLFYFRRYLLEAAEKIEHRYLMVYSTDTVPVSRITQYLKLGFRVIYEYVDDINPDLISPRRIGKIMERHRFLIGSEDALVVATADKLYDNVRKMNGAAEAVLIPNGAECGRFLPESVTDDREYLSWLRPDSIHAGYYGALASWVDYDLLAELAEDERIQIILIGIEHDDSLAKSGLTERENVRYFGRKEYASLAGYVHYFDVCIIPFLVNEITMATSPVKLFEYMAMGKPVVTTELPECRKYNVVKTAGTKEEFKKAVYECYEQREKNEIKEGLRECAWENDWSARAEELKRQLSQWENDER